ncbi:uncharacterized protein LOC117111489, partial [Anneissia japonica]|uniref:uncharacterized protein LOC117111489 n=1 Tax=Anneissia japonica TaxID=1529436 RepID=UPI0014259B8E
IQTPKLSLNLGQASSISNASSNSGHRCGEVITLGLKRQRLDEPDPGIISQPGQKTPLDMVNELSENIDRLSLKDIPEFSTKLKSVNMYLKNIQLHLEEISKGSIVFHLSVYDPYALINLWEIHSSRELIKDFSGLIVPENLQDDFIIAWKTVIEREEYECALRRLKKRVQYDTFYGIISDDMEWESQMAVDLTHRRPDLKFNILKHWRLCKPETINDLIAKSRKIIIAFSPKPLTEYSKYAAHSVVVKMLEAKALDDAKIIPVKISEGFVVPPEFASFTVINASEEHFVDKLLQVFDECEETESVAPDVPSFIAIEGTSEPLSSHDHKVELVETSETSEGILEDSEDSDKEHETQLVKPKMDISIFSCSGYSSEASEGILEESGDSNKEHETQLVKPKMDISIFSSSGYSSEVQYGSCIISDDMEWESQMAVDLTQRRPELRFAILKHWKLSKPETINDLIARSRKVIIAFSPKPLTEYSKCAAHSVVKMLEANILDDAQIIPIKISEDSVVPPEFASFTVINASEENFVDKILQGLIESVGTESETHDVPSSATFEDTSEQLSSDEQKTLLVGSSEKTQKSETSDLPSPATIEVKPEKLPTDEHKTQLVGSSETIMETQESDMPDVPSIMTFKGSSGKLSSDEIKIQLEGTSETITEIQKSDMPDVASTLSQEGTPGELSSDEYKAELVRLSESQYDVITSEDPDVGLFGKSKVIPKYPPEQLDVGLSEMKKLSIDSSSKMPKGYFTSLKYPIFEEPELVYSDLRGYVAKMLHRKTFYGKDEGLFKEKERKKEYFTQSQSIGPSFIKSSQDMDDSEPSVAHELPSKGTIKYESHIEDICKSLRMFSQVIFPRKKVICPCKKVISESDDQIIRLMSGKVNRMIKDSKTELKQSSEDIGKMFAHVLIAVQDEQNVLEEIHELCTNDIVSSLSTECKKLNFKYDITRYYKRSLKSINISFLIHLLCSAPALELLRLICCDIKGVNVNDIADTLYQEGVVLQLTDLNISENNLNEIKGSSLATLLAVAPKLNGLNMINCRIPGAVMDDMVKECFSRGVVLELTDLNISGNNLIDIKGSSLATLLAVAPNLNYLRMSNCSIPGAVMDDMVKECSSRRVVLQLTWLDISGNNLNEIKGSSLATLLAVAPNLNYLGMSNCSIPGAVMDDMVKECSSRRVILHI